MSKKQEQSTDYSKYTFRPNTDLTVSSTILDLLRKFTEEVLSKEGVGVLRGTEPQTTYFHIETGVPAKSIANKKKKEEWVESFDWPKTQKAKPTELLLDLGMKSLAVLELLNSILKENVDDGKGVLKTELEAEIKAMRETHIQAQQGTQPQPKTDSKDESPKLIVEPNPVKGG